MDVGDLADLVVDPATDQSWRSDAACIGAPKGWFFTPLGSKNHTILEKGKDVCRGCPVREACFEYAMTFRPKELHGVFGGTTQVERYRIHQDRQLRNSQERAA